MQKNSYQNLKNYENDIIALRPAWWNKCLKLDKIIKNLIKV